MRKIAAETLVCGFDGQTAQSPSAQALAEQIRAGRVGGVIFVKDNISAKSDVSELTRLFTAGSPQNVILAIDHEGGAVQRLVEAHGCDRLPSAKRVVAQYSVDEAQALYAKAGRAIARLGFNLNLAPVVDLDNPGNPAIGRFGRSYSDDADTVTTYARAFMRGFAESGVRCALKHFPGQGGAQSDSHFAAPDVSAVWSEADLLPFRRLIREGSASAVMSGYSVNETIASDRQPAALSRDIVSGLLRNRLGFKGVALTDDLDMGAVGYGFERRQAVIQALRAGNDLLIIRNRKNSDPDLPGSIAFWMSEALADGSLSLDALTASAARVKTLRNTLNT